MKGFEYSPDCITNVIDENTSEDCLTVNIAISRSILEKMESVPIIYHVHGDFNSGSNQIDIKNLVKHRKFMVISIAYRLGIWGFLHLPEIETGQLYQENWGILDMLGALEWAQEYAPQFGGNIDQKGKSRRF